MPENNELAVTQVDTKTTDITSDAVWNFMTSLKSVSKRDNQDQSFELDKLQRSIAAAMEAVGIKEVDRAEHIASQVISRLIHIYDGHTVPMTADIREVVNATLIDNNLIHVAKQYIEHRQRSRSDLVNEPNSFNLFQNYPNPFNPTTTIQYQLPERSNVILDVYNSNGQLVKSLIDKIQEPGLYQVNFDASNLPSGTYISKLKTNYGIKTSKMMLVK